MRSHVSPVRRILRAEQTARVRKLRTTLVSAATVGLLVGVGGAVATALPSSAAPASAAAEPSPFYLADIAEVTADQPGQVTEIQTQTETIKHDVIEQNDPTADEGTTTVVTEGKDGQEITQYEVTTVGGEEVSRTETITVTTDPIDEVVKVGTRKDPVASAIAAGASDSGSNRTLGQRMAADIYGWSGDEWTCLNALWTRESGWNEYADNPNSSAYGIPQALPGSKMAVAGEDWATNPATQIRWGLRYIASRYGSPCAAWDHSESSGWY